MVIKYFHPVKPTSAEGLVADIYGQVKRDFGKVVEPFVMHSPLPEVLAGTWMACRESEVAGIVSRATKEAVAAAVSNLNSCSYCVDAHTIMLDAAGEKNAADAISRSCYSDIADVNLRLMVDWAAATSTPKSPVLLSPPFNRQEAPEIIGTAVYYQYMNRLVTVLLDKTPLPSTQSWLKPTLKSMASHMFQNAVKTKKDPGDSLRFLPKANLPSDLQWAKHSPNVACAFARFAEAVEKAGERTLPLAVRAFVQEELNEWNGKASELSLAWSEEEIGRFNEAEQAAARLALFAALAPHKVEEALVLEFRKHFPEETKMLGALSWASFAAARKTGTWLRVPPT